MNQSKVIIFILVLLIQLVLTQNAFAIGISPAKEVINFKPGLYKEITLRILNTQNKDMNVLISKEGELSEYIKFDKETIEIKSNESEKYFTYSVDLPQKIDKPGEHIVRIIITEIPDSVEKGETVVAMRATVVSKLIIKVPYPGKYAEAELELGVLDNEVGIYIPITNVGTEDIIAKAKVKIFKEKELAEIETDGIEIKTMEKSSLIANWIAPSAGSYDVLANVYYDSKVIELEKKIDVGERFIKVEDVLFDKIKLGDVVQFDIIAKNEWNALIENVYADLVVEDKEGNIVAELKSASIDINGFANETLTAYWNTKGVKVGVYDLIVRLNYAGKVSEKVVEVSVEEVPIEREISIKVSKPWVKYVLVAVIVIIVILVRVILWLLERKR